MDKVNLTSIILLIAAFILVAMYYNEFREKFNTEKVPTKEFSEDIGDYKGPTLMGDLNAISGNFGEDINAESGVFDKDVSAETGKFRRIRVNRSDKEKWPDGWGAGVHTWDLYANATIATGKNGGFTNIISGHNGRIWSSGGIDVKGGTSEENPNGWWSHFPWAGDNKNYIRGDTEIRGATNQLGDLTVHKKIRFDSGWKGANDPYYIEKISPNPDSSTLRLTINDNENEAFEIWGDSCRMTGCGGAGVLRHKFQANGDAWHANQVCIGNTCMNEQDLIKLKKQQVDTDRINIGKRWTIGPEQGNEVLVFRDKLTGGDRRFAIHPGIYRDL